MINMFLYDTQKKPGDWFYGHVYTQVEIYIISTESKQMIYLLIFFRVS